MARPCHRVSLVIERCRIKNDTAKSGPPLSFPGECRRIPPAVSSPYRRAEACANASCSMLSSPRPPPLPSSYQTCCLITLWYLYDNKPPSGKGVRFYVFWRKGWLVRFKGLNALPLREEGGNPAEAADGVAGAVEQIACRPSMGQGSMGRWPLPRALCRARGRRVHCRLRPDTSDRGSCISDVAGGEPSAPTGYVCGVKTVYGRTAPGRAFRQVEASPPWRRPEAVPRPCC